MNKYKIAIINGKLFVQNRFTRGHILIEGSVIKKVILSYSIDEKILENCYVIDAKGCIVSYGFFDPHVHFRCPGQEYKEDWISGVNSAVKGGYTYILDMPNNNPPAVDFETLALKNNIAKNSPINYGFHIGLTNKNYKDIKHIYKQCQIEHIPLHGVKVFLGSSTGDLLCTSDQALKTALGLPLINLFHAEDEATLQHFDHIPYKNVDSHNKRRPPIAEANAIKKIIRAAKHHRNSAKIYICHVSSNAGIKRIIKYRKKGFTIFAEVTPHHLFFNLDQMEEKSNIFKVNPPIRDTEEVLKLRDAVNRGYFQIIGTDHAPHLYKEKMSSNPPSGIPGLESSFYAFASLYKQGILSLKKILRLLTSGYEIFNIKKRGTIKKGNFADLTIIRHDPFIFKAEKTQTKADFSPYEDLESSFFIDTVLCNGKILLRNGELLTYGDQDEL